MRIQRRERWAVPSSLELPREVEDAQQRNGKLEISQAAI